MTAMNDRMPNVYEELARIALLHPDWIERLPPMKKRLVQGALDNLRISEIAAKCHQRREKVQEILADIALDWGWLHTAKESEGRIRIPMRPCINGREVSAW